jgi:hypothetical protein
MSDPEMTPKEFYESMGGMPAETFLRAVARMFSKKLEEQGVIQNGVITDQDKFYDFTHHWLRTIYQLAHAMGQAKVTGKQINPGSVLDGEDPDKPLP